MSWMSVGLRSLSLLLILPLMLSRLPPEEVAVWYLLMTLASLQLVADAGFSPTFTRVIAFAVAGRADLRQANDGEAGTGVTDWSRIERIWSTMHAVYRRLTVAFVPFIALLGSVALVRPIMAMETPGRGAMSWLLVLVGLFVVLRANAYSAYLQGMNEVALVRRWEAAMGALSTLSVVVVLLAGGRLLGLVIVNQAWLLASALRDRALARGLHGGRAARFGGAGIDPEVMEAVWAPAIRSGAGVLMSRGVLATSGLLLAQLVSAAPLAAYLLASRLMQILIDFANAPFYSKLPTLARLRAQASHPEVTALAARGMRLTLATFVAGVIMTQLLFPPFLQATGSSVRWVSPLLWVSLGVAFFIERFGALHLQLYSITNDIRWHVANGVSGAIYLVVSSATVARIGVFAFPLGVAVGYLSFCSWYAAWKVRAAFPMQFWKFEREVALIPALVLLLFSSTVILRSVP